MSSEELRDMADFLRRGAKMLSENCPVCHSPLFEFKGTVFCLKCKKRVVIVKEGEEYSVLLSLTLTQMERTLNRKMEELIFKLERENDIDRLTKLCNLISSILDIVDKLRKIKSSQATAK